MSKSTKTWSTPVAVQESRIIPCTLCGGLSFKPRLFCEGFSYVRCTGCGLIQMNPQPVSGEVRLRYREDHGEDYLSYESANEQAFLRLQELSLKDLGFYDMEQTLMTESGGAPAVLDIGCATGALLETLSNRGWKTAGVEITTPQAEYARRVRGLEIRTQPLEECAFPPGSFQTVLASHLIEHLNDPASFVRELYRVVRSGGSIYITTPNIAGFQAKLFRGKWRSAIFDHLYLFSTVTLSRLLEQNGFTVEKLITWGGLAEGIAPAPVKRTADRLAKRFGRGDVMMIRAAKRSPL
jgi:2-polyprenyl-3-methyl-5-hydroxy-6-metoxy-1,4-benzoquinol methylase